MYNAPYDYESMNLATSQNDPNTLHCNNTYLVRYFEKYLLEEVISNFKVDIPKELEWDKSYFLYGLFSGYIGIIETKEYGTIPQYGTLSGKGIFRQPTQFLADSEYLSKHEYTIGDDCEIVKLQPNYSGIMDIVKYYANLMALCTEGITVDIYNSKMGLIFGADGEAKAKTIKKMYDEVASGNPAVVTDKKLFDEKTGKMTVTLLNNGYSTTANDQIMTLRRIKELFNTDVGIPNANLEKKAQMSDDEINQNNVETFTKVELWLETIKDCLEKVKDHFGIDISIEFRNKPIYANVKEDEDYESNDVD